MISEFYFSRIEIFCGVIFQCTINPRPIPSPFSVYVSNNWTLN